MNSNLLVSYSILSLETSFAGITWYFPGGQVTDCVNWLRALATTAKGTSRGEQRRRKETLLRRRSGWSLRSQVAVMVPANEQCTLRLCLEYTSLTLKDADLKEEEGRANNGNKDGSRLTLAH
ncbi:hypothetical protein K0M31_004726 [Melipona bicolor]|uniref:Uncharacterized protein n=1 Tax=Melipona bicolor TaxID=60889 RepID=A0AA40KMN7_9HYME|nr:hypothetical protein K0M31_004726 [Melipona bicolor]